MGSANHEDNRRITVNPDENMLPVYDSAKRQDMRSEKLDSVYTSAGDLQKCAGKMHFDLIQAVC